MKKITFILLTFFIVSIINAQCTNIASGFGNNTAVPMYNITGANSVQVVLNPNNTVTLNLMSNFNTSPGPDVKVFLVNTSNLTTAQIKATNPTMLPNIFFGTVSMNNSNPDGFHTYTVPIPTTVSISNYTKVFFYCTQFSQFWDFGTIASFTSANCSLLTLGKFELDSIKLYPNPVSNELNVELSNNTDLNYIIYNALGEKIILDNTVSVTQNKIDTTSFQSGIYFVEFTDNENNKLVKKFIKL